MTVKLTDLASCAGCAAKLRPEVLMDVINPFGAVFNQADYPDLMIGLEKADDAAVLRLNDEQALVFTTDFFPPPVDDPYDYGAIAAANSISDIFAMGGKPLMALNVTALPADLPKEMISEIFRGGAEKAKEAGCPIVGGHTIRDNEPKYGLAVVGMVHPDKILYKGKLKIGDKIVLTKPIGFGVTVTASKVGLADEEDLNTVIRWMKTLNGTAAELAVEFGSLTGTDVTGFSLLGHSWELVRNSEPGIGLRYDYDAIPFTPNYEKYMEMGMFSAGANENYNFYLDHVRFSDRIDENHQMMLFDPQTSGGLLLGIAPDRIDAFMDKAEEKGQFARIIGEAVSGFGIEVC